MIKTRNERNSLWARRFGIKLVVQAYLGELDALEKRILTSRRRGELAGCPLLQKFFSACAPIIRMHGGRRKVDMVDAAKGISTIGNGSTGPSQISTCCVTLSLIRQRYFFGGKREEEFYLPRVMIRGLAEGLPRWRAVGSVSWRRGYEKVVLRPSWTSVLRAGLGPGDQEKLYGAYKKTDIMKFIKRRCYFKRLENANC